VGRTPWSAPDAIVRLLERYSAEADLGVGRGRARPPHVSMRTGAVKAILLGLLFADRFRAMENVTGDSASGVFREFQQVSVGARYEERLGVGHHGQF
jgi:hypothetical protein